MHHNYFVYIITNPIKTVLYTGVTNNLLIRLQQHYENRGQKTTFAGKYHCYKLLYYESHSDINYAHCKGKGNKSLLKSKERILNCNS